MSNNQAKTIEAKKDEFRTYLEKSGVVDNLTRVLVSLYEENDKPQSALDFIKKNLNTPDEFDTETLKNDFLKLKDENDKLRKIIDEQKKELDEYKKNDAN